MADWRAACSGVFEEGVKIAPGGPSMPLRAEQTPRRQCDRAGVVGIINDDGIGADAFEGRRTLVRLPAP